MEDKGCRHLVNPRFSDGKSPVLHHHSPLEGSGRESLWIGGAGEMQLLLSTAGLQFSLGWPKVIKQIMSFTFPKD